MLDHPHHDSLILHAQLLCYITDATHPWRWYQESGFIDMKCISLSSTISNDVLPEIVVSMIRLVQPCLKSNSPHTQRVNWHQDGVNVLSASPFDQMKLAFRNLIMSWSKWDMLVSIMLFLASTNSSSNSVCQRGKYGK